MDTLLIQIGRAFEIFVKKKKLFDKTIKNNPWLGGIVMKQREF